MVRPLVLLRVDLEPVRLHDAEFVEHAAKHDLEREDPQPVRSRIWNSKWVVTAIFLVLLPPAAALFSAIDYAAGAVFGVFGGLVLAVLRFIAKVLRDDLRQRSAEKTAAF
jgi:hypothetical protein